MSQASRVDELDKTNRTLLETLDLRSEEEREDVMAPLMARAMQRWKSMLKVCPHAQRSMDVKFRHTDKTSSLVCVSFVFCFVFDLF